MTRDEYYMTIAMAVRKKANCLGRKVGAVIVRENRIISTGYNGTPEGMTNCLEGGCVRCRDKETYASSVGYDVCICVHAEQNALISAARFGNSIEDAVIYSTLRPCFDCSKAMLQAKVHTILLHSRLAASDRVTPRAISAGPGQTARRSQVGVRRRFGGGSGEWEGGPISKLMAGTSNFTFDRTAGSHALAAAGQRAR